MGSDVKERGRGGTREGAGRPRGTGKFGEETRPVRIPVSDIESVLSYVENGCFRIPLYETLVSAGFPSPAEDAIDQALDLNQLLIRHPAATFFLKVSGDSMINAGIHPNDILVVDRSLAPNSGKIIIAAVNGELTVKRLLKKLQKVYLVPENDAYPIIEITEFIDFRIWGVVTSVIHQV
jgi:DNA polymerase V